MIPLSDSPISNLSKDIEHFYNRTRQCPSDITEKEKLCQYIGHCVQYLQNKCIKQAKQLHTNSKPKFSKTQRIFLQNMKERTQTSNNNWTIQKFGSETWGTSIERHSDIDIAVRLNFRNSRTDKLYILKRLSKIISEHDDKGILRIQLLLSASYPIIRVYHTQHQHIKADISIADRYCLKRNHLIIEYMNWYEKKYKLRIKQLIVFIKYWSKQRCINNGYHGYLNSFGYTLLVLHFIQYYDEYDADTIVLRFFEFYAYKYNQCLHGIAIDTQLMVKYDTACYMEVIDPVNVDNNVAKNVGYVQCHRIQTEFVRAIGIIRKGINGSLFDELTVRFSIDELTNDGDESIGTNDDSKSVGTKQ